MKLVSLLSIALVGSLVACVGAPDDEELATGGDDLTAGDQHLACKRAQPKSTPCPGRAAPVCGCDGKTYGNACLAARVVTSSTPGVCGLGSGAKESGAGSCRRPSLTTIACPTVYQPVCGCDGKTYGNACEARRAVTSWDDDACQ